ncbi:MAG: 50S ribosomal protein L35 [Firmicutes bacterium]|nr:50S ribosomal protein L35 [Bacillota bacterium]
MPKLKTHRGAAKRFKVSGSGKIIRFKAFKSHILEKKSPKTKRNLRKQAVMSPGDAKKVKKLVPYL